MTHSTRTLLLRTDAVLLALFGLFGFAMDLLGYFAGIGAWKGIFFNDPLAIGVVEAHGLAIVIAILLLRQAPTNDQVVWHLTAMTVHLLLGICNLVFWQVFINSSAVSLGIAATTYHFLYLIANSAAAFLTRRKLVHA